MQNKWTEQARSSFEDIRKAIMESPTLISLDYTKGFYILSFASYDTVETVMLHKDDEGFNHPIAFFNKTLRDVELIILLRNRPMLSSRH